MKTQTLKIGKGNCIKIACENVVENSHWLFCFAYVQGQGKLTGQKILHAWNELGEVVFDFSNRKRIVMRKEVYYKIARITDADVTKQTPKEVMKLMLETETYGGWIK